jgi:hypothetical protein
MTTNSAGFYTKLKFHEHHGQKLMIRQPNQPMVDTSKQ